MSQKRQLFDNITGNDGGSRAVTGFHYKNAAESYSALEVVDLSKLFGKSKVHVSQRVSKRAT